MSTTKHMRTLVLNGSAALSAFLAVTNVLMARAAAQSATNPIPRLSPVMPEVDAPISAERTRALSLFKALTGIPVPIDDPRLKKMEDFLKAGQAREAVQVATSDPLFYDVKVRDFARKMSTRDETARAPLNDFVATLVGVVRDSDSTSAKELLTGNFVYRADPDLTMVNAQQAVPQDIVKDIINSNNHYNAVTRGGFSLHAVLKRYDGQVATEPGGDGNAPVMMPHPDPAGLLTTRTWVESHASAGTNRRMVEYTFREFMCMPITDWADSTSPDDRVGRDVDRMPSGSNNKYQTTCKACHSNMDGLRGAYAKVDFNGSRATYNVTGVAGKMNRNGNQFPGGFVTKDDSFINYATVGKNADQFGWRTALQGKGMKELGTMIAGSQGFSRCMVKRVFSAVCKRDPNASEDPLVRRMADDFESSNYHMRKLFETVALRPECLGSN